jgi:hypothetical protein
MCCRELTEFKASLSLLDEIGKRRQDHDYKRLRSPPWGCEQPARKSPEGALAGKVDERRWNKILPGLWKCA